MVNGIENGLLNPRAKGEKGVCWANVERRQEKIYNYNHTTSLQHDITFKYTYDSVRYKKAQAENSGETTSVTETNSTETPAATTNTEDAVELESYGYNKIHSATANYTFRVGAMDNNKNNYTKIDELVVSANGGLCYKEGIGIQDQGYTYGGSVGFHHENPWTDVMFGTLDINTSHQGWHFKNEESSLINPNYLSKTTANLYLGGEIAGHHFGGAVSFGPGYELNHIKATGVDEKLQCLTFNLKGKLKGTITFPSAPLSLSWNIFAEGRRSLNNWINPDIDKLESPWGFTFGGGIGANF